MNWIAVEDRLPTDTKAFCLVYAPPGDKWDAPYYAVALWTGKQFAAGYVNWMDAVTHWIKLEGPSVARS